MFSKRRLAVTLEKAPKETPYDEIEEIDEGQPFFAKADYVFKKFDKFAIKAALVVAGYIVLDTIRQVAVARASQPEYEIEEGEPH